MGKTVTLQELYKQGEAVTIDPAQTQQEEVQQPQPVNIIPAKQETTETQQQPPVANKTGQLHKASIADVASVLPKAPKKEIKNPEIVDEAFASMYQTLDEKKEKFEKEILPAIKSNAEEMALERELGEENYDIDNDDSQPTPVPHEEEDTRTVKYVVEEEEPKHKPVKQQPQEYEPSDIEDDDEDDDALTGLLKSIDNDIEEDVDKDELNEEESNEEALERYKDSLSNVSIAKNVVDLSTFKIRKKPTTTSKLLAKVDATQNKKTADWALYYSKKSVTFTECTGPELDNLRKTISRSNGVNAVIVTLKFVYNHIVDANKPSFELWAKTIRTEDVESLYFGLYRACYADANYISRLCSDEGDAKGCGKSSIIDTDIDKMVKYADKESEEEFKKIYNSDTTTESDEVESTLLQISDNIAISYRNPTVYSTFMQFAALRNDIVENYQDTLDTLAYIDEFFEIDAESHELIPIIIKEYPNNFNKTVLSRLKAYIKILKSLSSDQYNMLIAKLNNLIKEPKVTYVYPEVTCPECGLEIPEEPVQSVLQLLFTRAQLVQIKSL